MAQLEPLEHNQHPEGGPECPACVMTTEIFNDMAQAMERASLRLSSHDIAFILALLFQAVIDAAPTDEVRASFIASFVQHMAVLSQEGYEVRWLLMEETPNQGAMN